MLERSLWELHDRPDTACPSCFSPARRLLNLGRAQQLSYTIWPLNCSPELHPPHFRTFVPARFERRRHLAPLTFYTTSTPPESWPFQTNPVRRQRPATFAHWHHPSAPSP